VRSVCVGRVSVDFAPARTHVLTFLGLLPQSGHKMEGMRSMLGRFGLSGHHHLQPIAKLSGAPRAPSSCDSARQRSHCIMWSSSCWSAFNGASARHCLYLGSGQPRHHD